MPTNNAGKASPGSKFRPPPAVIWNNMVDAGQALAEGQLSSPAGPPIRPRETDLIKIKNDSGADRRRGEILRIEGKAIEEITDEHVWLLGVEPTDYGYFGILKEPVLSDSVVPLQVSGCCLALVTIIHEDHNRAKAVEGDYVLESSADGPIEILYAPSGTGEQECVVRFTGGNRRMQVKLKADLFAAVDTYTDPSTAQAYVIRRKENGDMEVTSKEIAVVNRFENISVDDGTYAKAEWIDGEWQLYAADCPGGSAGSESIVEA